MTSITLVREPHQLIVSLEPNFSKKMSILSLNSGLCGPVVARGPYVPPSCSNITKPNLLFET